MGYAAAQDFSFVARIVGAAAWPIAARGRSQGGRRISGRNCFVAYLWASAILGWERPGVLESASFFVFGPCFYQVVLINRSPYRIAN